jgi:threonine synthase
MSNSSVILQYADKINEIAAEQLSRASIAEYANIVGPYHYAERELFFLDLSSKSPTGTFKDWLACVTIAYCLQHGITEFVTQTSGNTGNALVRYAEPHGIKVHVFYPKQSRYKIQPNVANSKYSEFIELDKTELELKEFTAKYAEQKNLAWLPKFEHQIEANKIRAYYLNDWSKKSGISFDWHVQSLSSAYGVFGFYRGLAEIHQSEKLVSYPKLLGVHQAAVAPYYDYLQSELSQSDSLQDSILEPTLFRSRPPENLLQELKEICDSHGGTVTKVDHQCFNQYLKLAQEIFLACDLEPKLSLVNAGYSEKLALLL